jgi:protein TonB
MHKSAHIMTRSGRLGSVALSVAMSGVMFGLLATLGWKTTAGRGGPEVTLLFASSETSEELAASEVEELPAEQHSSTPPVAAAPESAKQPERPAPSDYALRPVSERPATSLASASPLAAGSDGAQGKTGRGSQTGAASAATTSASAGTPQAVSVPSGGIGDAYGRTVFARIKAKQSYVQELARDGIEGSVTLDFLVDPRGRLRDERVATPSGNRQLDRIALDHLREAAPFPAPPRHKARAFTIRLTYRQTSPP